MSYTIDFSAYFSSIGTLSYAIVGTPPAGVSIDSGTGVLTVAPTVTGTFEIAVSATDSIGTTQSNTFRIVVVDSSRPYTSGELSHIASGEYREIVFAKLEFASGTLYVHNGPGTYTWGSQDWLGVGDFGGISGIRESTDTGAHQVTLQLSGIDPDLVASGLDRVDYKNRGVTLYVGFLDSDYQLIADPKVVFRGIMDVATVSLDDKAGVIELRCEHELIRLVSVIPNRLSDPDHRQLYPDDLFFEHQASLINRDVTWGGQRVGPAKSTTGGSEREGDRPTYSEK